MNRIIAIGAGAAVAILVIVAAMVPITMEFADEIHSSESNNDDNSYNLNSTNKMVKLEIIGGVGYINGDRIGVDFRFNMIMFTDSFIIVYSAGNAGSLDAFYFYSNTKSGAITEIVLNDGEWTATKTDGSEMTGTYTWVMRYAENGDYFRMDTGATIYVDADAEIYIAHNNNTDAGLWAGTVSNISNVFKNNTEIADPSITYSTHTTEPEVFAVTGVTGGSLFVPVEYSIITPTDETIKTIINLMPLFTGIILFAALGLSMMRLVRSN